MKNEKDQAQQELERSGIQPSQIFRHYKGGEYKVVATAIQEDTLEQVVVYRSLAKGITWVRTLTNWNQEVAINGKKVKRFERIG